jgi:hypothetical protein
MSFKRPLSLWIARILVAVQSMPVCESLICCGVSQGENPNAFTLDDFAVLG